MPETLIQSLLSFSTRLIGYDAGTMPYYIVLATFLLIMTFVVRLLGGAFGSNSGIFAFTFVVALSISLATLGYAATEVYVLPVLEDIQAEWVPILLPWAAFAILLLLVIILLGRRMLSLHFILITTAFVLGAFAGIGGTYAVGFLIDLADVSQEQPEQPEPL